MKTAPLLFAGSSHVDLAKQISALSGIELGQADMGCFPDGETSVCLQTNACKRQVFILQSIAVDPNRYLMELLLLIDALKRSRAASITPIIPYFGYGRQDRKTHPGASIAAKLVANLLKDIDSLITLDLHAEQIEGFFDVPVQHLHCQALLCLAAKEFFNAPGCIVAADIGSIKLAERAAKYLDMPLAVTNKQRKSAFEVHASLIGDVANRDVLIFDDVCSTGGTLVAAAHLCKQAGARRIAVAVTHALFAGDALQQLAKAPLEAFFTTNTVHLKGSIARLPIKTCCIAPMLAEAINAF